jgi:predicted CopG family antitoxin
MASTTISLERSAYELLRARKLPDESFSEEIHRLLGPRSPALKDFLSILSPKDGADVADSIEATRSEDLDFELRRTRSGRRKSGHRA